MTDEAKKKAKFRSSKKWKDFIKKKKQDCNHTCFICGIKKKKGLHVHHCNPEKYEDLNQGFYVLCNACHRSLIERLVSMKSYDLDINKICRNIKKVYNDTLNR